MKGSFSQSFDKLEIFPVGSIYTSINSTSPATLFGGTWEQIQGRFLLSASSSYAAGGTGGAATINLSHVHSTGNHTLTISQIPNHDHPLIFHWQAEHASRYTGTANAVKGAGTSNDTYSWVSNGPLLNIDVSESAGGGAAHNHGNTGSNLSSSQSIMPPYLTVYMWKRTA